VEVDSWILMLSPKEDSMREKGYRAEFRRRVVDLVEGVVV
jgi:hypothetical protein